LHFIGHGGFDDHDQDGMLVLEDEHDRGVLVSGKKLGMLLYDHRRSLRLAVLNACKGARAGHTDPFSGTAQSLVQQGIPAVIAMQFEISDEAAVLLTRAFYTALAEGQPVDTALASARKVIFARGNEVEWGTPVLYLRSPDGHIFDVEKKGSAPPPPSVDPQEPVHDQSTKNLFDTPPPPPPPGKHRSIKMLWGAGILTLLFAIGTVVVLWMGKTDTTYGEEQYRKGAQYYSGEGVQKNYVEAAKWYRQAAELGHANAQVVLGSLYLKGEGVEKDETEAMKWFRKAAEKKEQLEPIKLGQMYLNGWGLPKDDVEGGKWIRRAAEQGDVLGQIVLGGMYLEGKGGMAKDATEAVKWLRKAADQGSRTAYLILGGLYGEGLGVEEDYTEAEKWFRKAAEEGDAEIKEQAQKGLQALSTKKTVQTTQKAVQDLLLNMLQQKGSSE
jgi:TPR repeat protein